MKKYSFFLFFMVLLNFLFLSCQHQSEIYKAKPLKTNKKKIVVYFNRSGGGHVAATQVIREALGEEYEIIAVNFSDTYLDRGSFFSWISNGKFGADYWYNSTLKHGNVTLSNFFAKNLVPGIIERKRETITEALRNDYNIMRPDLVISTIPFVNGYVGEVVKEKKIPFIVTTQDGDLRNFSETLKGFSYKPFRITVGINGESAKKQMLKAGIPKHQIKILHHPVRTSFLTTHDRKLERKKLDIPQDAFTVMILLGAAGSNRILKYTRELLRKHQDIYVIACVGRSKTLKQKLMDLSSKERLRVIGFTKEIPQLMTASDLFLTKPGPNSIIESLYMGLPILADHSSEILIHEQANLDFVVNNNYGREFTSLRQLLEYVEAFKDRGEEFKALKEKVSSYKKGNYRPQFKRLVKELLP